MNCDGCEGSGFLLTTKFGEPDDYYIERCDACEKYAGDSEANEVVYKLAIEALKQNGGQLCLK